MERKRCLVLLPVGVTLRKESPTFLALYQHILLPALHAIGLPLDILRGDEIMRSGLTLSEGQRWLQEPHLVLADLTTGHSGVIHDLSLRTFLANRTILLSQRLEDIPRQFVAYRRIVYDLTAQGRACLQQALQHHVRAILHPAPGESHATEPASRPVCYG